MEDILDPGQVQSSCCHIRRNEDTDRSRSKRFESFQPLLLLELRVDGATVQFEGSEQTVQSTSCLDAVHEDQGPTWILKIGEEERSGWRLTLSRKE
jgi:hypothetical protein